MNVLSLVIDLLPRLIVDARTVVESDRRLHTNRLTEDAHVNERRARRRNTDLRMTFSCVTSSWPTDLVNVGTTADLLILAVIVVVLLIPLPVVVVVVVEVKIDNFGAAGRPSR